MLLALEPPSPPPPPDGMVVRWHLRKAMEPRRAHKKAELKLKEYSTHTVQTSQSYSRHYPALGWDDGIFFGGSYTYNVVIAVWLFFFARASCSMCLAQAAPYPSAT